MSPELKLIGGRFTFYLLSASEKGCALDSGWPVNGILKMSDSA